MLYYKIIGVFLVICIAGGLYFYINSNNKNVYIAAATNTFSKFIHNSIASSSPTVIDNSPLGGYNVLIADRGNNRLIEVNSAGQIIWQYNFNVARPGLGADDAFFVNGGSEILASLEDNQLIELIDYQTKKVLWSYGSIGHAGSKSGLLNTPDDAYPLPNGDIIVADIKNCRVLEISPSKQIVHQYGQTGQCTDKNGYLNKPNGDTPLPNGNILISNITGHSLVELNSQWQRVLSMVLPIHYPSDPQMTKAGNILVSDVMNPGKIIEISPQGKIVWQYTKGLDRPSIAIELPNSNILAVDDQNQRIIVIDPQTKKILWQYGTTGVIGNGPNQLFRPDGVDIIQNTSSPSSLPTLPTYTVGEIT